MTKALAILAATLAFASALADGFLVSTNALSAERRAALETLCERLEARGFPRLPSDAKPMRAYFAEMPTLVKHSFMGDYFSCRAWQVSSDAATCTNDFVGIAGQRFSKPAEKGNQVRALREVSLVVQGIRQSCEEDVPGRGSFCAQCGDGNAKGKSAGLATLFAAGLFRAGHEAEAGAIVAALEDERGLTVAEREACEALARADVEVARREFERTGDFAALSVSLEASLKRNPPATGADGSRDAATFGDMRDEWLKAARIRLEGPPPDVPGLNDLEQELARCLADWDGWKTSAATDLRFEDVPWILSRAWTNAVPVPNDAVSRIACLGHRGLAILAAMASDTYPARWKDIPWCEDALFATRGDVARELYWWFLPCQFRPKRETYIDNSCRRKDPLAVPPLLASATEDDLLRLYAQGDNSLDGRRPALLRALFALRFGEGPFEALEDDILHAVRENTLYDPNPFEWKGGVDAMSAVVALRWADLYLAIRGIAAEGFRRRLRAEFGNIAASFTFPEGVRTNALHAGGHECFQYESDDPRLCAKATRIWAGRIADALGKLALGDGAPSAVRARAAAAEKWFKTIWRADVFPDGARHVPPAPLPFLVIGTDYDNPLRFRPWETVRVVEVD